MKILFTDEELAAYAEGLLSDAEARAIERKAVATGQTDLLLSVIIAQAGLEQDLANDLWGVDTNPDPWVDVPACRIAAHKDEKNFKKND